MSQKDLLQGVLEFGGTRLSKDNEFGSKRFTRVVSLPKSDVS